MRTAIIGGGVMGLAAAFYLTRERPDMQIDLYESAEQPGGLATYHDYGEFIWDRFYHCILPGDEALIGFIRDLGLGERLRWRVTRTGFFDGRTLHSMSNTMEFLRFPLLGLWDKLRLGAALAYCGRIKNWRRLESELAERWLTRMCGRRAYETIWRPLLRAKYGAAHNRVSAVAIWAAITRLYSARQPGVGKEMLGHVEGGYRAILTRALDRLRERGVKVHLGTQVNRIERSGASFLVALQDGREEFDRVVVTVPASIAARLLPALAIDCGKLDQVEYLGVVCLVLALNRPLSPFYLLNIADESVPFTGVIEMSNLVGHDQTAGRHLVYIPKYVSPNDPFYQADAASVRAAFLPGIRKIFPDFHEEWITAEAVVRAPRVQPLQTLNYSNLIEGTHSREPGLHVVNSSRLTNATLNNNEIVRLARELVSEVMLTNRGAGMTEAENANG